MVLHFDVFTLFPEVMQAYLQASVLGKAQESSLIKVMLHNIRDFTTDRHRTTDDEPYGGGGGMVMKPEPLFKAVETVLGDALETVPIILLTPQGRVFDQRVAFELAKHPRLALISGRYEGVDERVRQYLATDEISIGDYVLTGGELPALILIDAVARLFPGVLGDQEAPTRDSHATGLLEHPHYTRPAHFRNWRVPEVLLSGDHARVRAWRREQSLRRTLLRRPDLLEQLELDEKDQKRLDQMIRELSNDTEANLGERT
jgi:tRNA (guanine37-N1)-methyltransferase